MGCSPTETITLGAGCFWCLDAIANRTPGILSSVVGYAGGTGPAPTYHRIHSSRQSGYIEAVQLTFDPEVISLADILQLFFGSHDPTTPNQDGANFGPEYHSTIFYHSEEQRERAVQEIETLERRLNEPVATSVRVHTTFFEAEPEHQGFYERNPNAAYCRVVIQPKLQKLGLPAQAKG